MLATERPPPMGGRMRRLASLLLFLLAIGAVDCASPSSPSSRELSPDDVIKEITKNISMYCTAPPPQRVASDHGFYVSDDMNTPLREKSKITNQVLVDFIKALMNMELGGKIRKFFAAFSTTPPIGGNLAVTVVSSTMSLTIIVFSIYFCISYKEYGEKDKAKKTLSRTTTEKSTVRSQKTMTKTERNPSPSDKKDSNENRSKDVTEKKSKDSAELKSKEATEKKSKKSTKKSKKSAKISKKSAKKSQETITKKSTISKGSTPAENSKEAAKKTKVEKKSKEATEKKTNEKTEKKSNDKTEKKSDEKVEKKSNEKTDKKSNDKTEKSNEKTEQKSKDSAEKNKLASNTPTASKEAKESKEKGRIAAGKGSSMVPVDNYREYNPVVPGPEEDCPVENTEVTAPTKSPNPPVPTRSTAGLAPAAPVTPVIVTPVAATPVIAAPVIAAPDSDIPVTNLPIIDYTPSAPVTPEPSVPVPPTAYELELRDVTKAYEGRRSKMSRFKYAAIAVLPLILLCVIGASLLFGASIMTYLNTEATRVSLVQDEVHSLRTELAKIACQSSPPEVVQKFNEIATEKKMTSYIVSSHAQVEKMYPDMAYSKLQPVMFGNGGTEQPLSSAIAFFLRNVIGEIDANNEDSKPIVVKLNAMATQFEKLSTDLDVDWDSYRPRNETLNVIVTSTVKSELSKLAKTLFSISALKDPNFMRKQILDKLKSLLHKDFIAKAVNESGLYGNPFWTYLTLPLFIVAAIFAFQTACTCCHNSRLYYLAAIVTSLCVITSGVALNQSFGGLQNACHYLEHETISIENTTLSLASSKWEGFKVIHGISHRCGGVETYGETFNESIQYAVKKEFDDMRKKAMKIIDELSFSKDYVDTMKEVASKLTKTNEDIGAGIELLLKLESACSDKSAPNVVCGFNSSAITFTRPGENGGLQTFKSLLGATSGKLSTITESITKNPFIDVLAPINTLQDMEAYKNHLRLNIKSELDQAEQSVTDLLKRKMNAKCHFTTIYHNIVRRACDPVMKPTNALINVNYVVAFGFPLCGLILLAKGYITANTPRLQSLRTKKEKTERSLALAEEASNVQQPTTEGGDNAVDGVEPVPSALPSEDYMVMKDHPQ